MIYGGEFTYFTFLVGNVNNGFAKRMLVEQPFSKIRMLVTLRHIFDFLSKFSFEKRSPFCIVV